MTRQEAEKLIGQKVLAWTSMNGEYVGVLEEIIPQRPWRGKVRITSVVAPAAFETLRGTRQRKGFRPGAVLEVGGVNIKPTDKDGCTYLEALERQLANYESMKQANYAKKYTEGWIDLAIVSCKEFIEQEKRI